MRDVISIRLQNISKRFPGVLALDDVSISVRKGTCHALAGENGAGKSTLGKIIAGMYRPDGGSIEIDGQGVSFGGPGEALKAGIGIVHQELAFCENMTVAENLCLEDMPRTGMFISRSKMMEKARGLLEKIGCGIDVARTMSSLTVGQQQLVQIASAIGKGAHILIFDEPTSSLSEHEARQLFAIIRDLKSKGVTSVYVSHRMDEIFEFCEEVTVLRDGRLVGTVETAETSRDRIIEMMIGRSIEAYFPNHIKAKSGKEVLRVENLTSPGKFADISFSIHAGEIVGMAGLVGAGRTEIAQAIFGLDPAARGKVSIGGRAVTIRNPVDAISADLGLIPEDRKHNGLVLSMSVKENISLGNLSSLSRMGWIKLDNEMQLAKNYFRSLDINAAGMDVPALNLSGGNQQKLVLARWLAAGSKVLLFDEPTRGIDVGAKAQIHSLIDELACKGTAILLISSELPELLNLSSRVLVVRDGRIRGELDRNEMNQDKVLRLMAGL